MLAGEPRTKPSRNADMPGHRHEYAEASREKHAQTERRQSYARQSPNLAGEEEQQHGHVAHNMDLTTLAGTADATREHNTPSRT